MTPNKKLQQAVQKMEQHPPYTQLWDFKKGTIKCQDAKSSQMNEKIKINKDVNNNAHCLQCMPEPNCQSWPSYVVTHYSSAVPFHLLPLFFSCPCLSPVCANQLLCWSVSKCLRCNLMKANSHKGGKLLPGNSTPQAVLFIFLFPLLDHTFFDITTK